MTNSPPHLMEDPPERTLLQEIDARQDEVIEQLDKLNARVEELLGQYLRQRGGDTQPADP